MQHVCANKWHATTVNSRIVFDFFGRKTLFEHEPVLEFQRTHTKKQPSNQKNNYNRRKQQTNNEQQPTNKRQINIHLLILKNVRKCFRDLFIRSSRGPSITP